MPRRAKSCAKWESALSQERVGLSHKVGFLHVIKDSSFKQAAVRYTQSN